MDALVTFDSIVQNTTKVEIPRDDTLLEGIISLRCVYVLAPISEKNRLVKARYYTCCVAAGPNTRWGLWSIKGNFQRFFARRSAIEHAYPQLVWHRKAATWALTGISDLDPAQKVEFLEKTYHHRLLEA